MNLEKIIAATFEEMAQGLETGSFGRRPKIALTGMGSEHGETNSIAAAKMAAERGVDVYYIGTLEAPGVTTVHVANEDEGHFFLFATNNAGHMLRKDSFVVGDPETFAAFIQKKSAVRMDPVEA